MLDRRSLLFNGLAAGAALPLAATPSGAQSTIETVPLWPGKVPGGERVTVVQRSVPRSPDGPPTDIATYGVTRPTLTIVRPARPNGIALLMVPGGAYLRIALSADGGQTAHYFAERGYTVGALLYRLPYDGWAAGPDAPLQDAQRAFRLLKARAGAAGKRAGVIGFSAGGHLAGRLATAFAEPSYAPLDGIDRSSARPDFAGLFYPVVTMTDPHAHKDSRKNLLGKSPSAEQIRRWSIEQGVTPAMPPTFVSAAEDDGVVRVENSVMFYQAMRAARVPGSLHIFDHGGHGFGKLTDAGGPGRFWPQLFQDWLSRVLPTLPT